MKESLNNYNIGTESSNLVKNGKLVDQVPALYFESLLNLKIVKMVFHFRSYLKK